MLKEFCRKINRVFHVWSMIISSKYITWIPVCSRIKCYLKLNKRTEKRKREKKEVLLKNVQEFYVQIKHISQEWKKSKQRRKDIKIKLNLKTCGKMKIYAHCEEKETQLKNAKRKIFSVKNWILKMHFYHKLHYIRLIDSLFSCASSVLRAKRCFHAIVT